MAPNSFWGNMVRAIWIDRLNDIEYYFAKRWLDKTFGTQEYWGDYIADLIRVKDKGGSR